MSLSGKIRQGIPPIVTSLTKKNDAAAKFLNENPRNRLPNTLENCRELQSNIESHVEKLTEAKAKLQAKHTEWENLIDSLSNPAENNTEVGIFGPAAYGKDDKGGYFCKIEEATDTLTELNVLLRRTKEKITELQTNTPNQGLQRIDRNDSDTRKLRLPELRLPKFRGEASEFPQFWSLFEAIVGSRNLTNTEKFSYLQAQLEGPAYDTIAGLLPSDANYSIAVDMLKSRYQLSKEIQTTMLYAEFKKIKSCGNPIQEKRKTYNACEKVFRQLEACDVSLANDHSLALDLLSKFPSHVVRDLNSYHNVTTETKLPALRKALQKYIDNAERMAETIDNLRVLSGYEKEGKKGEHENPKKHDTNDRRWSGGNTSQSYHKSNPKNGQETTSAFVTMNRSNGKRGNYPNRPPKDEEAYPRKEIDVNKSPCYFCDKPHRNFECPEYPTARSRKERADALRLCHLCLRKTYDVHSCPPKFTPCYSCKEKHNGALCPKLFPDQFQPSAKTQKPKPGDVTMMNRSETRNRALLMTAKCQVINPKTKTSVEARLILDSASHREYIVESLSKRLDLKSNANEQLGVKVFGSDSTFEIDSKLVSFGIKFRDGTVKLIEANTTPMISDVSVLPSGISKDDRKILEPFQTLLADNLDDKHGQVDILLGAGHFWDLIDGQPLVTATSLKLIPSKLGLLIGGRTQVQNPDLEPEPSAFFCLLQRHENNVDRLEIVAKPEPKSEVDISDMWKLERIGISDDPVQNDDEVAMESFRRTVRYNENEKRYEVQWPWVDGLKEKLPSNEALALGRFKCLDKRLRSDEKLFQDYRDIVKLQIDRGIVEKVPEEEKTKPKFHTHYLPHHPVIKPHRATTKVRIVYDASARVRKGALSLNEAIYRGPVILPNLCEVLIRFRMQPVAVVADLEKAFLQLLLDPCDRDVTRFFWYEDDKNPSLDKLAMYRFQRVAFGITASPFLLGAVIQLHLSKSANIYQQQAARDTYVDNVIMSVATDDDGIRMYHELKQTFQDISMNLQEWCSNSTEVMSKIPESDHVKNKDTKVLGVQWNSPKDTLRISNRRWPDYAKCTTKREVMTAIATIYDPLGWYQPAVLPAKVLLQSLWVEKYAWDDPLPKELQEKWTAIHAQMFPCYDATIPRYIGSPTKQNPILVGFSDASEKAYGAAVYLHYENDPGYRPQLLISKSRLAPTGKKITIARLELLGLFVVAQLVTFLRSTFQTEIPVVLFCDSKTVLHWIKSSHTLSRFVTNRIKRIRELTSVEFRYANTKDNPADLNTRGSMDKPLAENDFWWHGPPWLTKERSAWPTHDFETINDKDLEAIESEYQKTPVFHSLLAGEGQPSAENSGMLSIVSVPRFRTMPKLLRTTVRILKFIKRYLWNKIGDETKAKYAYIDRLLRGIDESNDISASEIRTTKDEWIRSVQKSKFSDVFQAIKNDKKNSLVSQLGLRLDSDGILRSYSRYDNADIPDELRYPKLLPKSSEFTDLAIREVHESKLHIGVSHTLSEIRREFWIPHGRQAVRSVLTKCLKCRKFRGAPFELPTMPPWPIERVSRSSPFQFIGLDYFGPITVKSENRKHKCWVCLFTCLVTRAVHLEYVANNSSIEFLNCLKRFVSRRGVPIQIISDNAAQFRVVHAVSERVWSNTLKDESVATFCANRGVEWKFTTQLAPWQGGFYERLVGVVKSVLRGAISRKLLEVQEFVTLLTEVEAIVNSRPITCVNDDIHSRTRIIRPADFLTNLPICDGPNTEVTRCRDFGTAGSNLSKYWNRRNAFLENLWKRWEDEYLLSLRERGDPRHRNPRSVAKCTPELHEIVLVYDKSNPRMSWKLAKITKLIPSHDGQIRSAEILLPNRQIIRRSVKHLIPLEVRSETTKSSNEVNEANDLNETNEFWGFSEDDVQETERLLERYRDLDIDNLDDDNEPLTVMCLQIHDNIRQALVSTPFPGLF